MSPEQSITLVVGCLLLLAGWTLYWVSLNISGAILGGGIALALHMVIARGLHPGEAVAPLLQVLIFLGGAVVGAIAARFLHRFVFFVLGAAAGIAGFITIFQLVRDAPSAPLSGVDPDLIFAFGIPIAGTIVGLLGAIYSRLMIAVLSSVVGALLVSTLLEWPINAIAIPPMILLGLSVQLTLTKRRRKKKEEE